LKVFFPVFVVLLLWGCTQIDRMDENERTDTEDRMGEVRVTELEKNRTHVFEHRTDGIRTLLVGNFIIDGRSFPGRILYDGRYSYVFKPDPDECIVYPEPDHVIYGFLPAEFVQNQTYLDDVEIDVMEHDEHGLPTKYRIDHQGRSSVVEYLSYGTMPENDTWFVFPAGTKYIKEEDFFINVR